MVKPVIRTVDDAVSHSPADAPWRIAVSHAIRGPSEGTSRKDRFACRTS